MVSDSVYAFKEQGLFKVQVGDYQFRYEADNMRDNFRKNGYDGAWVIQRMINIPIAADTTARVNENVPVAVVETAPQALKKTEESGQFKIQLMAIGSEDRARTKVEEIKGLTTYSAFYEKSGNLYKVFIGYFKEETVAREALRDIRDKGYPDAWLVY
jgi:cell division septation protein DedD